LFRFEIECLPAGLKTEGCLDQRCFARDLGALVDLSLSVRTADDESALADGRENRLAIILNDRVAITWQRF